MFAGSITRVASPSDSTKLSASVYLCVCARALWLFFFFTEECHVVAKFIFEINEYIIYSCN